MKFYSLLNTYNNKYDLKQLYKKGNKIGAIRLSDKILFFRSGLNIYYIPYDDIYRYYRRIKLVPARMCCARMDLEIEYLVLCDKKNELAEIQLPNKRAALSLMERLKTLAPNAKVGSNKKRKSEKSRNKKKEGLNEKQLSGEAV